MKSCKYYYKDRLIGDVIKLDDFLISKQKYHSKYGDLVFQTNAHALDILKKSSEKFEDAIKAWNVAKKQYADDEELILLHRPFVGVTEFLSGQRNSITNNLYFPEFRKGDYWSERFYAWTKGKKATLSNNSDGFTQDEIDLFFDGDESKIVSIELGNPSTWKDTSGEFLDDFGNDEQKRLRNLMIDKWEHQAKYGTEIHNVLEKYFSNTEKSNWRTLLDGSQQKMHLNNFITNLRNSGKITDVTTNQKVEEIIEYAKQLKNEIETKFGEVTYFPEYTLCANLNKVFQGRDDLQLTGRVDLLFLDKNGFPHIVDYKASPKQYEKYNSAKRLGFTYQLATYERMLSRMGLRTDSTQLLVAPIQMENFHKEGDVWTYDKINKGTSTTHILKTLHADTEDINKNLDDFIESSLVTTGSAEGVIEKVKETFEKWFPNFGNNQIKTDEEIRDMIDRQGGFKTNPETGDYEFTPKGWKKPIKASSESALFQEVKSHYTGGKQRNIKKTEQIRRAIADAKKAKTRYITFSNINDDWLRAKLSKYCGDNWEIMEGDYAEAAMQFGMILFRHKGTNVIETIKISNRDLKYVNSWGNNRVNLVGAHESDISENSRSNSLMVKAANGNIELMEAMLVLNSINFDKSVQIGKIDVISSYSTYAGLSMSNKELMYCWKKFQNISPTEDKFKTGQLKILTTAEACYLEFKEILSRVGEQNTERSSLYEAFKPALSEFHKAISVNNVEEALSALHELRKELEITFGMDKDLQQGKSRHLGLRNYDDDYERILYQQVSKAILELSNFNIRQSLTDHDSWLQSLNIFKNGISGNRLDNAGNFGNQLLNQITALALEGYQNSRDLASRKLAEMRANTEKLKKDTGFSGLLEHTIGNQASLFNGMIEYTPDGDIRFINPWKSNKLQSSQIEYLKYAILAINKDRYSTLSEEQIKQKIEENNPEFFQVPLMEASFASKINNDGWLGWLKNKFKRITELIKDPEARKQALQDLQSAYLSNEEENLAKKDEVIFKTVNLMDQGNSYRRREIIRDKIAQHGKSFFETNVETILSNHIWAYATQEALENRMPLLKAAFVSLAVMGNEQNYEFSEDEDFFKKFLANRIKQQSIVDEKLQAAKGAVGVVQQGVSWLALAFSPLQFTYQTMESIWKNCKLIVAKPDGTDTFTAKNMWDSAKQVYKELSHYSDKPSVISAVNVQYGINDMDNVAFAQNNTSNNHGIFNFFGKFAYKFSSRPDFYNRMTIFIAQMMQDGSFEAHSIDKNGQLKYDYSKDKRFAAFVNNDTSNMEEYNKAKSMYYTVANQLVAEGARNSDGSLFTIGQPLPKAYSNKESEAKKAVGDSMYGYYDSTKKSIFQGMFLGSLLMQMRTYWSAKKNQYFAPGGVKAQGQWIHAEEEIRNPNTGQLEKKKLYYAKLDNGELDRNGPLVTKDSPNCSNVPFLQWKGKFEEGIVVTMSNLIMESLGALSHGSIKDAYNVIINKFKYSDDVDPELTKAYRSNVKILLMDLLIYTIIGSFVAGALGDWADDEEKNAKKTGHMSDAMYATFANLVYRTVKNSTLDANWISAIFDVSMDWNPMAVVYVGNEAKVLWNFITDDQTAAETLIKSMSAARQMRPILECIDAE